jgi:hypothetical protein
MNLRHDAVKKGSQFERMLLGSRLRFIADAEQRRAKLKVAQNSDSMIERAIVRIGILLATGFPMKNRC